MDTKAQIIDRIIGMPSIEEVVDDVIFYHRSDRY